MAWLKGEPHEGILAPDLNDVIRDNNEALETYLNREHIFSTGGTIANQIMHKQGSARAFFQDTAPATRVDGSAFASTDLGLFWIDTNSTPDNQLNILTATTPTWTPVSTEIIAVLLASARVFGSTLGVTGNFAVNTDKFKVTASNGNTLVAGTLDIASTIPISAMLDEDNMSSDSATAVSTQQSIKASRALSAYTTEDADNAALAKAVTYTAVTDGYVTAKVVLSTVNHIFECLVGGVAVSRQETETSTNTWFSVQSLVAAGETFRINTSAGTPNIYWKSFGPLSKPTK